MVSTGFQCVKSSTISRARAGSRRIFLTAFQDDEKLIRGYNLGAVDYLVKPIEPEVLKSKVGALIELARKNQLLLSHAELLESKNFGVTSLNEVRAKLSDLGLRLRND